jgi:sporulation protein YlmC with PRC-barrel domain
MSNPGISMHDRSQSMGPWAAPRRARNAWAIVAAACTTLLHPAEAADERAPRQPLSPVRLEEILWRPVQDNAGQELGGLSDVLVEMPAGRVVFLAIDSSRLFDRPKAVPPGAVILPPQPDAPFRLEISRERWIAAPLLDWEGSLVLAHTGEGERIYGYYQQAWRAPELRAAWGAVAVPSTSPPPARYISLKGLLLNRVVINGREQAGYIRDFLIDWSAQRATHAIVSPQFTPLAQPGALRYAVPLPLLKPPAPDESIPIGSTVDAFQHAPVWPADSSRALSDTATIFRYPAAASRP